MVLLKALENPSELEANFTREELSYVIFLTEMKAKNKTLTLDSFRELGLRLPFLEKDDVTTALAFLKSIDVWRGKSTNVILKG